ncbi:MAG TPA: isoleucine--tRNA ligase [Nitrososphaeraceae archaeon]|nr:isoleucine--tRNA ligase [Nitrososphaeraceae archaeon]
MKLGGKFIAKEIENEMRDRLNTLDLGSLVEDEINRRGNIVGYIEGPPTMNGEPHVGHLRGRIIKDLWYRYNILQKRRVIFRAGWDCQGLPVELQAEKELGLTGSKIDNVRRVGIEKIVTTCKQIIQKYNEKWILVDKLLGMSFDYDNAYWTFHDKYIEREWKYLEKAWKDQLLKEWFRVVAYCPSCQTSLSNAEVNQGYKTVEDPSFYYKVKLSLDDVYLIIWTTMPFTMVTDEMVAVNPEQDYARVKVGSEEWIVGQHRAHDLLNDLGIDKYSVVQVVKGRELEGLNYIHPLLNMIPGLAELAKDPKVHSVVAEEFVDITTGSGIVHLAPANGQEDFQVAERRKIPIFVPIDDRAAFTQEAGLFQGLFVRDADAKVIEAMKAVNAYLLLGRVEHQYPTCWRSHHKIVWLARREYFYMIEQLEDRPILAASNVEYFFDAPRNRYLEIIKEKVPWCISRERIWGTPLPIWTCRRCSHKLGLFSRNEIIKYADHLPDGPAFELHRPQIDRVEIKCGRCGSKMQREPFVLDTWHNSGAAPYASLRDDEFSSIIPAAFMTEGVDQTRGWAYTLLMQNVILTGGSQAPFKSFLFQGHVLDEKGNKMSKSLGNVIDAYHLLKENAVDLVRFYFMWKSSPIESLNFSLTEMTTRTYQIMSTLFYLHVYFSQNSQFDNFDRKANDLGWALKTDLLRIADKWVLSKLEYVINEVTASFQKCRFHEGAKSVEEFVINTLSQTYIPMTRNEIWDDSLETLNRRLAIYAVLGHVLRQIDIMIHPFSPYTSDYLYLSCFSDRKSVLLEAWPARNKALIDIKIETVFDKLMEIVSLSNSARMKAKLRRRWPIRNVWICYPAQDHFDLESMPEMLKTQINVQNCIFIQYQNDTYLHKLLSLLDTGVPITPKVRLSKKNIGQKARGDFEKVLISFENVNPYQLLRMIDSSGEFMLAYENGRGVKLTLEDLELSYDPKPGFALAEKDGIAVIIDGKRDKELIALGVMRDIARNLQQLRKERGYNTTDIIPIAHIADLSEQEISDLLPLAEELKYLVRVNKIITSKSRIQGVDYKVIELDGRKLYISV